MPVEFRKVHQENDRAVMCAYGFDTKVMQAKESLFVAELFKRYQKLRNRNMRIPPKGPATILHLSEMYCEQYSEKDLCLSPEQNDAFFSDFVGQYNSATYWGKEPSHVINTDIPLF